jgi:hypothetical protein
MKRKKMEKIYLERPYICGSEVIEWEEDDEADEEKRGDDADRQ